MRRQAYAAALDVASAMVRVGHRPSVEDVERWRAAIAGHLAALARTEPARPGPSQTTVRTAVPASVRAGALLTTQGGV